MFLGMVFFPAGQIPRAREEVLICNMELQAEELNSSVAYFDLVII